MVSIKEYAVPLVVLLVAAVGIVGLMNTSAEPTAYVIEEQAYEPSYEPPAYEDSGYSNTAPADDSGSLSGMAVDDLSYPSEDSNPPMEYPAAMEYNVPVEPSDMVE